MDVLNHVHAGRRSTRLWRGLGALVLLGWLGVTACLSLPVRRAEPSFPHHVHVVEQGLTCTFCHPGAVGEARAGLVPRELCATCHDRFDADKPAQRRLEAFFDGAEYRAVANSGLVADVEFAHARHAAAGLDCAACHGDVAAQREVPLAPLATKSACMDCHARAGMSNACGECHSSIDTTWRPGTHAGDWLRNHGPSVHAGAASSVDRCSLCHVDATSCLACHQQMPPRDHGPSFRLRGHGIAASIDRNRCFVCHTQDSCEQCHQETRPLSHRGGFGSPRQRHCGSCHFPLQDSGCAVCHRSAPSHELAAPLPPDHSPAMNCRLCHGNGQSLPHPDGGHACTICHR